MTDDYQAQAREVWEPVNDPLMTGWHMRRKPWPPRFRSPQGEEMAANTYGAHRKRVHREREEAGPTPAEPHAPPGVPDLPAAKSDRPDPEIKRAGLATPKELADTAFYALLILTTLLAILSRIPEFAMSQEEAAWFSVPIGNILERSPINRAYGKYLKDGGDYLMLGWGLYAYLARVQQQIQLRAETQRQQQPAQRPAGPSAPPRPLTAPAPPPAAPPATNGATPPLEPPPYAGAPPFAPRAGQPQ